MSIDAHKNGAYSTVAGTTSANAVAPGTGGTAITVQSGDGADYPAVPFNAPVCPASSQWLAGRDEIVRVTAIVGDTFTVERTQESSTNRDIQVGDQIYVGPTAKTFTDIERPLRLYLHANYR